MKSLILGLVIAIFVLVIINKTTSGFTAAECDATYTTAYTACSDAFEKAKKACSGRNNEKCVTTALHARQACYKSSEDDRMVCMGQAAAKGDTVADKKIQDHNTAAVTKPSEASSARVTPGGGSKTPVSSAPVEVTEVPV